MDTATSASSDDCVIRFAGALSSVKLRRPGVFHAVTVPSRGRLVRSWRRPSVKWLRRAPTQIHPIRAEAGKPLRGRQRQLVETGRDDRMHRVVANGLPAFDFVLCMLVGTRRPACPRDEIAVHYFADRRRVCQHNGLRHGGRNSRSILPVLESLLEWRRHDVSSATRLRMPVTAPACRHSRNPAVQSLDRVRGRQSRSACAISGIEIPGRDAAAFSAG